MRQCWKCIVWLFVCVFTSCCVILQSVMVVVVFLLQPSSQGCCSFGNWRQRRTSETIERRSDGDRELARLEERRRCSQFALYRREQSSGSVTAQPARHTHTHSPSTVFMIIPTLFTVPWTTDSGVQGKAQKKRLLGKNRRLRALITTTSSSVTWQ